MVLLLLLIIGVVIFAIFSELEKGREATPKGKPRCPSCDRIVDDEWLICPHCRCMLREHCRGCGRQRSVSHHYCPYCGQSRVGATG